MVYNLALRLSGNKADAQDIAQDAFLKAVRGLADFRGDAAAGTWLYRITVNVWKNRVRSEKRRSFWRTISLGLGGGDGDDGDKAPQVAAPDPALDAGIEKRDEKAARDAEGVAEKKEQAEDDAQRHGASCQISRSSFCQAVSSAGGAACGGSLRALRCW